MKRAQDEWDAFISYAREDEAVAKRLSSHLRGAGYSVWFDREQLLPGQMWRTEIESAIPRCLTFIAVISNQSVSKVGFVQRELKLALEVLDNVPPHMPYVIPVRIDPCEPVHKQLREIQWLDLFEDSGEHMAKLVETIQIVRSVRGYEKVGAAVKAMATIRLRSLDDCVAVVLSIRDRAEADEVWLCVGEDDIAALVSTASVEELDALRNWIAALPGVADVVTQIVMNLK